MGRVRLRVANQKIPEFFRGNKCRSRVVANPLPEDVIFTGTINDPACGETIFCFESAEYEETIPGQPIPFIDPPELQIY